MHTPTPPPPHSLSRESIVGQHSEVRRRGRGGAAGLLESTRRILCETETSGLTETRRSCEASVSSDLLSASSNPPLLAGHVKGFLQLNLLVRAVTKRQLGTDVFLFFPPLRPSLQRQMFNSLIDNE